jgi:hypothetical protein
MKPNTCSTRTAGVARGISDDHRAVALDAPTGDAADADGADVARIVHLAHLELERAVQVHRRRRAVLQDGVEQRQHVLAGHVRIQGGVAVQGRGIHHREIQLLVGGAELVEQVEGLVQHPVGPGTVAVDLVDDHDGLQTVGEGLLGDETGLGHRAVHRIHHQEHAVHHGQHPLHFAAEVGMAGGIHDVDAVFGIALFQADGGVLRQDGDAAFLLQVVGVHDPLGKGRTGVQGAGLTEQAVHQGGLAMVDVGDDGDVAEIFDHGRDPAGKGFGKTANYTGKPPGMRGPEGRFFQARQGLPSIGQVGMTRVSFSAVRVLSTNLCRRLRG